MLLPFVGMPLAVHVRGGMDEESCAGENKGRDHGCLYDAHHGIGVLFHLRADGNCYQHSTGPYRTKFTAAAYTNHPTGKALDIMWQTSRCHAVMFPRNRLN